MFLHHEVLQLTLRHPFQIARGNVDAIRETIIVRGSGETGETGLGEATPIRYMGESIVSVCEALDAFATLTPLPSPIGRSEGCFAGAGGEGSLSAILDDFAQRFPNRRAAQAGIDFALHDLLGKREGKPVHELLGLDAAKTPVTSFTIGMAAPDVLREKVEQAAPYAVLKVKLGSPADWDTLTLIRSLTDKRIRVDANEGWTAEQAIAMTRRLLDIGVELVEQPVPRDDLDALAAVTQDSPIPVIADESCQQFSDVARLAGKVHGINIKLMKCGGIREGLKMIRAARGFGMKVMIGCMIETSVGITAAAHLTPLVDYADLDGNLLITNDPYVGVTIANGRLRLPEAPGLGLR